jgi:hypothetical protein
MGLRTAWDDIMRLCLKNPKKLNWHITVHHLQVLNTFFGRLDKTLASNAI